MRFHPTFHRITPRLLLLLLLSIALLVPRSSSAQTEEPANLKLEYTAPLEKAPAIPAASAPRPAARPAHPSSHITSFSIPVSEMPTEDVDVVEVMVPGGFAPATAVWPVEGALHFIDEAAGIIFDTETLSGPNISGVDFISDGTWGVHATLGFLHIFDMAAGGGLPVQTVAPIALPGTPARRDIDPMLISHAASPSGVAVVYATGTEIHCYAIPTGALLWSTPLPAPVVEAVDPQINAANNLLFVPTEGFVTAINPVTGAILSTTALNTQLVREIDGRFVMGGARFYMPALGTVFVFSGTPPGAGGTGALLSTITLNALVIEGNDLEVDPTGVYGFIPTLAFMYQIDLATATVAATYPFRGASHERNQDVVFTPLGVAPAKAVYCTEDSMWIYTVVPGGPLPMTVALSGDLIDAVDPAFTDVAPAGTLVTVSTNGFTHLVDVMAVAHVGGSPMITDGALRVDVDSRPGPVPAGKILQPALGGLWILSGFGPSDWVVPTSGGLHVVDMSVPAVDQFVPTGLIFRGGDAQPTTLLGPAEPGYSVDDPDQDFVTKCSEYKYAVNRHPYWYSTNSSVYYPNWVPYGVWGPPAQVVHDLADGHRLSLTGPYGSAAQQVTVFDEIGSPTHTISLPSPAIGGVVWDQDNRTGIVRLQNQQLAVIGLSPLSWGGSPTVNFIATNGGCRWFPTVDRMNGWALWANYGTPYVRAYDYIYGVTLAPIQLPSWIIRPPQFDDQRKTWAAPLANRTIAFINTHRLRLGLPNAVYYSPDLGAQVVSNVVFDVYSHSAIVKLADNRISVVSNQTGQLLWTSPVLPYVSVGPMQVDCYNMTALNYYRNPADGSYYKMYLALKDLVYGLPPTLTWRPVPISPGTIAAAVPIIGSKIRVDIELVSLSLVSINPLGSGPSINVPLPAPAAAPIFYDRVNQYAILRLQGPQILWMDIFRLVRGLPNSTRLTTLQDINASPVSAQQDLVFNTREKMATMHLSNGQTVFISGISGQQLTVTGGFPNLQRQLFGGPFDGRVTYPYYDGSSGQGGHVTFDVTPLRAQSPAQVPTYSILTSSNPPVEGSDFSPPPSANPGGIVQLPHQGGDYPGVVHFQFQPGAVEQGATIQAVNTTAFNPALAPARGSRTANPAQVLFQAGGDDPNEAQAEADGSAEIAVIAATGDQICFTVFDASGNPSPATCVNVIPVVGVPAGSDQQVISFALAGSNPIGNEARFRFTLAEPADVELALFDISGRRVATLVDGRREAGSHEVRWQLGTGSTRPAAGVYFARLRSGVFEASERFVILP